MKQTAVEWLVKKLSYETSDGTIISHHFIINKLVEHAKKMEKEQIIKANRDGVDMVVDKKDFILGEQYYNETFKTE